MAKALKICIDPGHGQDNSKPGVYDPGACGGDDTEADIALQWGLTLKWVLASAGIAVWMTRDDDRDSTPVGNRDDRAEAAGCTHFICLHNNAGVSTATGTETLYRDATDKQLASVLQNAAIAALGLKNRGLKTESVSPHGRLAVFSFDGPCGLVELGFITNAVDRARLKDRARRLVFAELVRDYFLSLVQPATVKAEG